MADLTCLIFLVVQELTEGLEEVPKLLCSVPRRHNVHGASAAFNHIQGLELQQSPFKVELYKTVQCNEASIRHEEAISVKIFS